MKAIKNYADRRIRKYVNYLIDLWFDGKSHTQEFKRTYDDLKEMRKKYIDMTIDEIVEELNY